MLEATERFGVGNTLETEFEAVDTFLFKIALTLRTAKRIFSSAAIILEGVLA